MNILLIGYQGHRLLEHINTASHARDLLVLKRKNEKIPGVSGRINVAQKSVTLITDEKDVQTLRLGEDEEDSDEDPEGGE